MKIIEPMFSDRANDRDSDVLVGLRPLRMIRALDKIFELSMQNSLITYISGDTGSGKSHILNHMKYLFKKEQSHQIVILNANDIKRIDEPAIIKRVHQDSELNRKFAEIGGEMSPHDVVDESRMIKEINERTVQISEDYRQAKTHLLS